MFSEKINALRAENKELQAQAQTLLDAGKKEEGDAILDKIEANNGTIASYERLAKNSAESAIPDKLPAGAVTVTENEKPFTCFGEQLKAVHAAKTSGVIDDRLLKVNAAVKGSNETTGADGGFAVQEDFAGAILSSVVEKSEIVSRVDSYTVGAGSNAARWLMIDESDVSATVFGGVQMYWAAEGAAVTASKPKMREMKLDLEKMMGIAYATDELLEDAAFMSSFYGTAFSLAADRLLSAAIVAGDGNSKPLGIMNGGALVTVAKETNQVADTIVAENILKMWQRMLWRNRKDAAWIFHPDCEAQLPQMKINDKNIWMPEGGISGSMYQTILGRPIIYDDNLAALGDKGDVLLCDLKQYMLLRKGSPKQDWSMHVEFLTDQMAFRMVFRCNGAPKMNKPITIKNSSNTRSPFVTLAARA